MNCEGPICRCGRVRHMWCQTANHAGEVFCTAHSSSQSDGAAHRLSQSRVRVLWVLCFPQTWNNSRLNDMWLAYYSSTQQTPRLRFLLVTRESGFVLINFTPKEDRTVLFLSSVGCVWTPTSLMVFRKLFDLGGIVIIFSFGSDNVLKLNCGRFLCRCD